jgi:DNA-binding transcriptional LysR family regulator
VPGPTDWNDLRHFLAAWRARSLAGAARLLKVDQTTVGRRLAALEQALGAKLFERGSEGLVPTATAEALFETAEAVEQGVIDFGRRAAGGDARVEGTVRLATTDGIAVPFLIRELAALSAEHPGIALEVVTAATSVSLLKREADLALRFGTRPAQQSVIARRAAAVPFGVYAAASYGARRPAWRPGLPLEGHEVVGFTEDLEGSPPARWLEEHGAGGRVAVRVSTMLGAVEACAAGFGLAVLPEFLARREAGLQRLSDAPVARTDLWLVVHPDLQHTARVRAVMDHTLRAVARHIGAPGAD